jgi:hypothetical protein
LRALLKIDASAAKYRGKHPKNNSIPAACKNPRSTPRSTLMAHSEAIHRLPSSMEPLLPASSREALTELSARIFRKSGELTASLPSATARGELAKLVCEMNSYYSNLIEG